MASSQRNKQELLQTDADLWNVWLIHGHSVENRSFTHSGFHMNGDVMNATVLTKAFGQYRAINF